MVKPVRRPGSAEELIPAGAVVYGRIRRVEHHLVAKPYFLIALAFNRVETGGALRLLRPAASPTRTRPGNWTPTWRYAPRESGFGTSALSCFPPARAASSFPPGSSRSGSRWPPAAAETRGLLESVLPMRNLFLALLLAVAARPMLAQGAPPQGGPDQPYTLEYYYKVQWGHQQEFLQLFLKNHYPLLQKIAETGRILSVKIEEPPTI